MDKGIYTALSGGIAKSHDLEIIANNLANSNTTGFKRDVGTFNEYLTELRRNDSVEAVARELGSLTDPNARPQGDKAFVELDGIYTDYRQGHLERTGRTLDVALEGDGFLEVLTPAGVRFTRQGNLSISAEGQLVTANGFPVLSRANVAGGPNGKGGGGGGFVNILGGKHPGGGKTPPPKAEAPPEARAIKLGEGRIEITPQGMIIQNGNQVAEISMQEFLEPQWLEKSGNSYFKNTSEDNFKKETTTKMHQGYLEGSNVNPISEMTRMIEANRAYESHLQAIKTYQDIDGKTVNDIARSR